MTTSAVSARALLSLAAEVEAAEAAIKQAVLDAAEVGDLAAVRDIVRRWQTRPASEVLSMRKDRPNPPKGLEPCGKPEVGVSGDPERPHGPGRRP
ncbi:hypothetical protein PHYC_02203 [Phycisphaerales bacterium]|nr:hypothetical protein PHYC_02203 [Phycisphaerales bacterium]